MIVLQPTTPNDLHSFTTTTTRSLNQPNASIAVGPQPVQQSMYQAATYPAHATFVYSPATNSVTQQQQGYSSPRSSSSLPARPSSADNIPLESAAYSSYRYDCNQMASGQESRSPQTQSSPAVIASEGVGQNYGATSDPRTSVGVSSSPQQASLGANMLPPLSEVLQQPPPPQQQQQQQPPQSQQQGQHQQQQHQQHQQPQQQVQNQQAQQQQVQNQQGQQQQVQSQNQQQQQPPPPPPTPQQQPPQQSQPPQTQSGSSSPATSPTQAHHPSSGSLMPPTAAAAAAAAQSVTAGFYHQMGQYPDVSAYTSQDGAYAAQASLIPPTQQQAAMVQQSMSQLGQQTSQLVTVVDPRLPPIAAQGGDLQTANLSTSLVDPSVRRLAISTAANMAMNQPESAASSTNALNNYQHLLNTPFMTAHPVMMAPPRSLHGRRDMADPSMQAMVERPQQKVYSFVPLPGINTKKRPRRRYDEIERHYSCNWPGCSKAYGTLNHLNAHVQMQKHGAKRHPSEFKELRKMWRRQKREEEERKAAEAAAVKQQSSVATVNINGIAGLHSSV